MMDPNNSSENTVVDEEFSEAQHFCLQAKQARNPVDKEIVGEDTGNKNDDEGTDDEAENSQKTFDYFSGLIRNHLVDTLSERLAAETLSETKYDKFEEIRLMKAFTDGLFKTKEFLLASFLKTALDMRQSMDDVSALAKTIDYLFRNVRQSILPALTLEVFSKVLGFLYDTLVALIRRNRPNKQENAISHTTASDTISHLHVTLGDRVFQLGLEDILTCFWGTRLDTVCHTCGKPFTSTPPIRTFISHDAEALSLSTRISIKVLNRHLHCLEGDKVSFIPVSHVWHESIRLANAAGVHSDDAAKILIDTLRKLLEGVKSSYDQHAEFWHDYFSVPQWQQHTKAALLMCIPAIYSCPNEILIHMADLSHSAVARLLCHSPHYWTHHERISKRNSALPYEELGNSMADLADLTELGASKWMHRVWVMLEYYHSKASCIMDQSGYIWRRENSVENIYDSFTILLHSTFIVTRAIAPYCRRFTTDLLGRITNMGRKASGQTELRNFCLGEAMAQVRDRQCQMLRDRFFAIHVILKGKGASEDSRFIPTTNSDACVWVWTQAIITGDYSPLFLQQRSQFSETENLSGIPSWALGCRGLDYLEWDLGSQLYRAKHAPKVVGGVVHVPLDVVGYIEEIHYLDLKNSGNVVGVSWAIRLLVAAVEVGSITLSCGNVVSGMQCIFPVHCMLGKELHKQGIGFSLSELQDQEPEFETKLQQLLEVYFNGSAKEDLDGAAEGITHLLQLDREFQYGLKTYGSRLSMSQLIAEDRKRRGALGGEPICKVRCSSCRTFTLSRLDLRHSAGVGNTVYRIPGLCYSGTVENGVGLVMRDGRITGQMLYDPPACACKVIENVNLV